MEGTSIWNRVAGNLSQLQLVVGVIISLATLLIGWKTYQLNEATNANNQQLKAIERQLNEAKFDFERFRDIYDRTEKYLGSAQQDSRRGKALVALINSLPNSNLRADLLGVMLVEAQNPAVAAKAADIGRMSDPTAAAPAGSLSTLEFKGGNGFIGNAVFRVLPEDRGIELIEAFSFKDSKGVVWTVPKGTQSNASSIPRGLWASFGSPLGSNYIRSSVLHEYYSALQTRPFEDVNRMFYESMLKAGVSESQASILYAGLLVGGPRW